MALFFGVNTASLLQAGMRTAQANHTIIANNIANADTPGFNPTVMDFEATLQNELEGRGRTSLRRTRPEHLDSTRYSPELKGVVLNSKNDYNKVDIDQEIANLSKNSGRYNVYASLLIKQFQQVKAVLQNER